MTATSAAVAGLLVAVPQAAADPTVASPFDVSLVSVLPDNSGAFTSTQSGVTASDDGHVVAFVGTGGGYTGQLFVRDRTANTTTLVSKDAGGTPATHPIDGAAMSANGNAVAFLTTASLLASVPDDSTEHVYVADWPAGTIHAVAVPQPASNRGQVVGDTGISLSADGSKVAFVRVDAADSSEAVVIADVGGGTSAVLPMQDGDNDYALPQLSADGAEVAYLVDTNNGADVRVSKASGDVVADESDVLTPFGATVAPFGLSADGKRIAFMTYVADRAAMVVGAIDGQGSDLLVAANRGSGEPRLSPDGSTIGYLSPASPDEIWVGRPVDSSAGQLPVLTADGSDPDDSNTIGQLTENGNAVVFSSAATNYGVPTNGSEQVYYATIADTTPPSWPDGAALSVDDSSYFTADLSWPDADDDVGAVEYLIIVDGKQVAAVDGYETTYRVTGLAAGSTHTFGVRAVDFIGGRTAELTTSGATQTETRTESVETVSVNAVGAGGSQPALVTTPPLAPDEAFASFQLSPTVDGGSTSQGTVTLPGPVSSDTTVTLSSDSSVAAVPHSVTVPTGQSSATFTVTTTDPLLDTDVTVTASRGGASLAAPITVSHVDVPLQATASDGSVALSWTAATDSAVTGYRVMRATGADGEFAVADDVSGIGTTTYTDSGVAGGTTYRYQVLALYAGSASTPWSAVAEATTPVVVTPVSLSATVSPPAPAYGQDVTVAVTMTPAVAGATVQVLEGSAALASGTIGADGTANVAVSGLHAGDHQLTVSYAGDANTSPASTTVSVSVAKAATTLTVDPISSLRDLIELVLGRYQLTAHLVRTSDGAPGSGQQVVIDSWKGQFCTATTDANGVATCPVPRPLVAAVLAGWVHASFAGSADYLPSSFGRLDPPGRRR